MGTKLKWLFIVHPDLVVCFIVSKCFAAKTGFPGRWWNVCRPWFFKMCLYYYLHAVQAEFMRLLVTAQCCWSKRRTPLTFASVRSVSQCRKRCLVVALHHLNSVGLNVETSWKLSRLISLPACEPFSYLYKNSFCKVLLKERGFDIWLFCKATWLLLSSCARVAKLSVTSVCLFVFLLIEIRVSFFLDFFFSLWIWTCQFFLFFNKSLVSNCWLVGSFLAQKNVF